MGEVFAIKGFNEPMLSFKLFAIGICEFACELLWIQAFRPRFRDLRPY
jgi:hypothetical protein